MTWIRGESYISPSHVVALYRENVLVNGVWRWRAKTLCGRTITGHSGESCFPPECLTCRKVWEKG